MKTVDGLAGARAAARMRSRLSAGIKALAAASALASTVAVQAQSLPARTAFVHLFEWKWTDVAKECESHLGPKGFAAVQVSPPNEHNWITVGDGAPFPWWMRYQPVSYSLDRSRSGTRDEFISMVKRCDAAGVSVYVDAVINHMSGGDSGISSAGRPWSHHHYSHVPFHGGDFHQPVCDINYKKAETVWNCELSGLQDLNTGSEYVRSKIADYLVDLVSIGVKGFRLDAAKHIRPSELNAIVDAVNSRVVTQPYWFGEVIRGRDEAVTPEMYFGLDGGTMNVAEFAYGSHIAGKFRTRLADLRTFGESWGLVPSHRGVAFIDNHDKQRGHAGAGDYMTYHWGPQYDLANVFMLAWPYGYPQVMSSYAFTNNDNKYDTSYGPPHGADGATRGPWDGGVTEPACFNQTRGHWVCEHRFRPIANMVGFRNATIADWRVDHWWDNGNNQIAFGRGNTGFVVINNEGSTLSRSFKTGLPAGQYCDVISGDFAGGKCGGNVVTVDAQGHANLSAAPHAAAAIHVGARLGDGGGGPDPVPDPKGSTTFVVQGAAPAAGESVRVVGDHPLLGAWDPCKSVALSADGSQHKGTVALPASSTAQYKFIKYQNCTHPTWESSVANRTVTVPATGKVQVCGVFNSAAACSDGGGGDPKPPAGTSRVTFNVTAHTTWGQAIFVVGSDPVLGVWSPASAKALSVAPGGTGSTNTWRATFDLPAGASLEYKYIKRDPGGAITWESGSNRMLKSPASGGSSTVADSWK